MADFRNMATIAMALLLLVFTSRPMFGEEADFLNSMEGDWRGSGIVKVNTSAPAVNVSCNFRSDTTGSSFSLRGDCRALLVVKKLVEANLDVSDGLYFGTYKGARSGTAELSGTRSGNTINLVIQWAGPVNGDRLARMQIRKDSNSKMNLVITDLNPKNGQRLTTSRFLLVRK